MQAVLMISYLLKDFGKVLPCLGTSNTSLEGSQTRGYRVVSRGTRDDGNVCVFIIITAAGDLGSIASA